jgi:endonuclease/exonuclease/phosphatase family metal-dependent hydrolase
MLPIKIVSFNTYLVARRFNENRVTHPEQRATRINQFVQDKDLCFLQEVWGSALREFVDTLSHILPPSRAPFSLGPSLSELANTCYLHVLRTGGLYDLAHSDMECVYRAKHTFRKSRSKSLKGVEATLWKIPAWKQKELLVLNTHLDPWHPQNRQDQVQEIVSFLETTLQTIEQERNQDWSQTGVLVMGDLNIKADSEEYGKVLMKQGWKDFFARESQHTYAGQNSLVCYQDDCGRLDYIFGVEQFGNYQFLRLECLSRAIVKHPFGEELSDHYPLVVELVPDQPK